MNTVPHTSFALRVERLLLLLLLLVLGSPGSLGAGVSSSVVADDALGSVPQEHVVLISADQGPHSAAVVPENRREPNPVRNGERRGGEHPRRHHSLRKPVLLKATRPDGRLASCDSDPAEAESELRLYDFLRSYRI